MGDTRDGSHTCVRCERHSDDPDRDGWHIFSDGADEAYALCTDCARARATARAAFALLPTNGP